MVSFCWAVRIFMKVFCKARLAAFAAVAAYITMSWTPAHADVVVQIDKSAQRMSVSVDGVTRYNWPVSTGRDGYGTPNGTFHPQAMMRSNFSRKYYNAPMPHAIFYYGFAITVPTTSRGSVDRPRMVA
jgi:lipoprotein-anchoring transpeptidase ErfK/SrfK